MQAGVIATSAAFLLACKCGQRDSDLYDSNALKILSMTIERTTPQSLTYGGEEGGNAGREREKCSKRSFEAVEAELNIDR
jgi:hypothetical protein